MEEECSTPHQQPKKKRKIKLQRDAVFEKHRNAIEHVVREERLTINPSGFHSQSILNCPYSRCYHTFKSAHMLIAHLRTHSAQEKRIECPFCRKMVECVLFQRHFLHKHPEVDCSSIELPKTNPAHKDIVDKLLNDDRSPRKTAVLGFLGDSIFKPSIDRLSNINFRLQMRAKLFTEIEANIHLIFKFQLKTSMEWSCLICAESVGLSWSNPFSLRLHALTHLASHVEQFPQLQSLLDQEWACLSVQIPTVDFERFGKKKKGVDNVGRSFTWYSLLRDCSDIGDLLSMMEKSSLRDRPRQPQSERNGLCLQCFSSFQSSFSTPCLTPRHFTIDSHSHLLVKGWSEFSEVEEIATLSLTAELFPQNLLFFSSAFQILEDDESQSRKILKWRCQLCSLEPLAFPTSTSMRIFALRHFEKEHPKIFSSGFYRYEWELIQLETSLSCDYMRTYDHFQHLNNLSLIFDVTDPGDFVFPYSSRFCSSTMKNIFICAFCFMAANEFEFLSHIECHGYPSGMKCSSITTRQFEVNEVLLSEEQMRIIISNLHAPKKILERKGKEMRNQLREKKEYEVEDVGEARTHEVWEPSKYRRELVAPLSRQAPSVCSENIAQLDGVSDYGDITETPKRMKKNVINIVETLKNSCTESTVSRSNDLMERGESDDVHPLAKMALDFRESFLWKGSPPDPLNAHQLSILAEFKKSGRCNICPKERGYRGLKKMTDVEESLLAHLLCMHHDNEDAKAILNRKKFILHNALESDSTVRVVPFLLDSVEPGHLTCSSCRLSSSRKNSNLVVHWGKCREKKAKEREEETIEVGEKERPSCRLCKESWRRSTKYSNEVALAAHLILSHTTDKEAYEMAMKLENDHCLSSSSSIDIGRSFALRAECSQSGIQCSKCNENSSTMTSHQRHVERYHECKPQCPVCLTASYKTIAIGLPISTTAALFLHIMKNHKPCQKSMEYMSALGPNDAAALREESGVIIDLFASIETWKVNQPRVVCAICRHESYNYSRHRDIRHHHCQMNIDLVKEGSIKNGNDKSPSGNRGRKSFPIRHRICSDCSSRVALSDRYDEVVSMALHALKVHPSQPTQPGLHEMFPFINFARSSSILIQCSLCEYSTKESRYMVYHAWKKHAKESRKVEGMDAWVEWDGQCEKKKIQQRQMPSRKREREVDEDTVDDNSDDGDSMVTPSGTPSTSFKSHIPSAVPSRISSWLSRTVSSVYSPSIIASPAITSIKDALADLFDSQSEMSTPGRSYNALDTSWSLFDELPEKMVERVILNGKAEDISHVEGAKGVRCSMCTFKGKDTEALRIHFTQAHQETISLSAPTILPCVVCSRVFTDRVKLRKHCEVDHEEKDVPHRCIKCGHRFTQHKKLRAHEIRVHETEVMVHTSDRTCTKCDRVFCNIRTYRQHTERHNNREVE